MPLDPEHRPKQPAEHYNPQIHVTAAALRKAGMTVPDNIPDHAWIPKSAVRHGTRERIVDGRKDYYLGGKFAEPFRVGDGTVDPRYADAMRTLREVVLLGPKGEPLPRDD